MPSVLNPTCTACTMESPHNSQGEETLWSSRLEVLIAISRVAEAIEALPSLPDNITVRRWNHGIGRELVSRMQSPQPQRRTTYRRSRIQWIAIGAIGLEGAASITAYGQQNHVPATVSCPPLVHLFRAVSWRHRRLAFDVSQLDHAAFLSSARALLHAPVGGGEDWGFLKWWKWGGGVPEEGKQMPGWWNFPTVDVVGVVTECGLCAYEGSRGRLCRCLKQIEPTLKPSLGKRTRLSAPCCSKRSANCRKWRGILQS